MNYLLLPVSRFVEDMGRRVIPSPAAGSSLALSLAMGCSLLELLVAEMVDKKTVPADCRPAEDLVQLQKWRRCGERLIDADIRAVETMVRNPEALSDPEWLKPMLELVRVAEQAAELALTYLPVHSAKQSDTLVAFLHFRTAYWGGCQIIIANTDTFNLPCPVSSDWSERVDKWDRALNRCMGG
ncbi:hypothetical protein [Desmospora profundinema]|uniref:Cyclodeaminase/cyclohydrolase domain-containing protein n=1 Tax=Desmospora profundinema TaxID=1571184 RepID=A0ABU1IQ36_9BACL|nr:hypothetical protein [Desmospora profundinema]MDR6226239.1 hypothetical protein [Desmospora profundinema]